MFCLCNLFNVHGRQRFHHWRGGHYLPRMRQGKIDGLCWGVLLKMINVTKKMLYLFLMKIYQMYYIWYTMKYTMYSIRYLNSIGNVPSMNKGFVNCWRISSSIRQLTCIAFLREIGTVTNIGTFHFLHIMTFNGKVIKGVLLDITGFWNIYYFNFENKLIRSNHSSIIMQVYLSKTLRRLQVASRLWNL